MTQRRDSYQVVDTQKQAQTPASLTEHEHLGMLSLEISIALSGKETLDDMLAACTNALVEHLNVALARIWLQRNTDDVLELQASSGPMQADALHTRIAAHASSSSDTAEAAQTASQREPRFVTITMSGRSQNDGSSQQADSIAYAGYPLLVREQRVGVLELFTYQPLSVIASQTLASVSNGIAMSIERQQMLEERTRLLQREQAAHREAEIARQHLHDLFMQAPALICVLRGPQHIYELANPLYLQTIGRHEIIGKPIREILPELANQPYFELLDRVYATGEPYIGKEMPARVDRRLDRKHKESFFNFVYQPTRNSAGEVDGILLHAIDITEQVLARADLKDNQERLEIAQQSGHIGTFDLFVDSGQIIWTPELEALYGLAPGAFEGNYEGWASRVHPADLTYAEESLQGAIAGGPPYDAEFRIIRPDGTMRWMQGKGIVHYDEQGQPWRVIGVNIDITERKEAEQKLSTLYESVQDLNANLETQVVQRTEALNQTNLELQRSNNELQEFAYVASHDLQEPLRKIQAFGNLLEEEYGEVVGEGKMYIERMRSAAARMRILIDDLLAFSRVTSKAQPFVPVDLNAVAQQVMDDLGFLLETTHGTIELGELPTIYADEQQMYQMLQNLLSNAIKFHQPNLPPIITVSAEIQQRSAASIEDKAHCLLRVKDNGIGFDEKYTDRIFTVFQRLHGKEKYEGTGIGLAVVRKIVERHNGTIIAQSSPGQGATFLVKLPIYHSMKEIAI